MTEKELIKDLKKKFKLSMSVIKSGLNSYEIDLIQRAYPDLTRAFIEKALQVA